MNYTVSEINSELKASPGQFIDIAEKAYHKRIADLATTIKSDSNNKIIMLAGPSGSGKTTTAHILCYYLEELNIKTHVISLDNFYQPINKMPLDEKGNPDFESVHSLDIKEIHRSFEDLINTGACSIPRFDFKVAKRSEKRIQIELEDNGLAIVEGIHALNPLLFENLPREKLFKLYISITSTLNEDGQQLLTGRQMRLIRRIVRDSVYRNSSAENTLKMWPNVLLGEEKYLYQFKKTADYKFDTFHGYEPAVLKDRILELLEKVPTDSEHCSYVKDINYGLKDVVSISQDFVPINSLIREFISGGMFEENY
ncbi:MAG: nucleoside kinase [Oscillospiraceae bacterium]|nr:nucleoside kinase [Oscillospiraceae bacterium]